MWGGANRLMYELLWHSVSLSGRRLWNLVKTQLIRSLQLSLTSDILSGLWWSNMRIYKRAHAGAHCETLVLVFGWSLGERWSSAPLWCLTHSHSCMLGKPPCELMSSWDVQSTKNQKLSPEFNPCIIQKSLWAPSASLATESFTQQMIMSSVGTLNTHSVPYTCSQQMVESIYIHSGDEFMCLGSASSCSRDFI